MVVVRWVDVLVCEEVEMDLWGAGATTSSGTATVVSRTSLSGVRLKTSAGGPGSRGDSCASGVSGLEKGRYPDGMGDAATESIR